MKTIRIDDYAHKILTETKDEILKEMRNQGIERPKTSLSQAIRKLKAMASAHQADKTWGTWGQEVRL